MDLELSYVRLQFPGLRNDEVFLDNAGGSLTLARVADRVRDYLLHTDVQLGATYATSVRAAERYREARFRMAELLGGALPEEVVFGPSSTILLGLLARAMSSQIDRGDEIIVTRLDHEANIGCWLDLAERWGATIRFWEPNEATDDLELQELELLLNDRTRLVAVTHVSNIRGSIHPIAKITTLVHGVGARICVDGVAFAPHRELSVREWDVDYYVFSLYKVFGPHHAVLYGKHEALLSLDSVNHYFFRAEHVPGKLEPGNANYELSYGSVGIVDYLEELGRRGHPEAEASEARTAAWACIASHEASIGEQLLAFLRDRDDITIIGRTTCVSGDRVPTVSFVHETMSSSAIVHAIDAFDIGIRYGHFYAARLIDHLDLGSRDGIVRASMVHYNTHDEIDRLIASLREVLPG